MELMETTTPTQDPGSQAGATPAVPPADRVRIVSTPGTRGGKPRIDGHRITVADVAIWYERMGMSPDEIVSTYPTITLSDVHAALAYYYEHRERIDADIREGEEAVDKLRAGQPSIFEKVRQRIAADAKDDTLPPG
jgi:uncharacterized protein (DUF433 family)